MRWWTVRAESEYPAGQQTDGIKVANGKLHSAGGDRKRFGINRSRLANGKVTIVFVTRTKGLFAMGEEGKER